jgi:hypothetical protein
MTNTEQKVLKTIVFNNKYHIKQELGFSEPCELYNARNLISIFSLKQSRTMKKLKRRQRYAVENYGCGDRCSKE